MSNVKEMTGNAALLKYCDKLERRSALPQHERDALLALPGIARDFAANEKILASGDPATHCVIVESGLVSRIKALSNGTRQIVAFHMAGDAVDLQSILFTHSDHEIHTHTPARTYWVPHELILDATKHHPVLANALWLDTLVDAAIFREWTVNIGQRHARMRIAHLFLELAARFGACGLLSEDDSFAFPVTQTNLAEALGLSLVHLNKSLQILRREGYVAIKDRRITLSRKAELEDYAGFDPTYLHVGSGRAKDLMHLSAQRGKVAT